MAITREALLDKTLRVIASVRTIEQWITAHRYMILAQKRLLTGNTELDWQTMRRLDSMLSRAWGALPKTSE